MRALMTDDPGVPGKRYTVRGNEGIEYGAFDTLDEVLEVVRRLPDAACTIRLGVGVGFTSSEADELRRRIGEL